MFADCRKCVYFIPFEKLNDILKEKAVVYAAKRGKEPLGWCTYSDPGHVITHYTGKCRRYTPKPSINMKITDFIKVQGP